jgi:hypothetical protein
LINTEAGETVVSPEGPAELVTDKGYHSREVVRQVSESGVRTYISEPERGRQQWKGQSAEQQAVYANRRRMRGERGKQLQRRRGEKLERVIAHLYETGRMRRVHLRGHNNIIKRLLIHACGLNLGLLMRSQYGVGTPRGLQQGGFAYIFLCLLIFRYRLFSTSLENSVVAVTPASDETPIHQPYLCRHRSAGVLNQLTSASDC